MSYDRLDFDLRVDPRSFSAAAIALGSCRATSSSSNRTCRWCSFRENRGRQFARAPRRRGRRFGQHAPRLRIRRPAPAGSQRGWPASPKGGYRIWRCNGRGWGQIRAWSFSAVGMRTCLGAMRPAGRNGRQVAARDQSENLRAAWRRQARGENPGYGLLVVGDHFGVPFSTIRPPSSAAAGPSR